MSKEEVTKLILSSIRFKKKSQNIFSNSLSVSHLLITSTFARFVTYLLTVSFDSWLLEVARRVRTTDVDKVNVPNPNVQILDVLL